MSRVQSSAEDLKNHIVPSLWSTFACSFLLPLFMSAMLLSSVLHLKQVAFVAYLFHHSFNDIKCFIYFSVLRSQNKTAAAPHLGTGDCCEEKRSNATESILKRGTLTGKKKRQKKSNSSGTNDCKLFCVYSTT